MNNRHPCSRSLAFLPAVILAAACVDPVIAASPSYSEALNQAIITQTALPDAFPAGTICRINIVQKPGGEVVSARLAPGCTPSLDLDRKVELAVLKATPLPYFGYEDEFRPALQLELDLARAGGRRR